MKTDRPTDPTNTGPVVRWTGKATIQRTQPTDPTGIAIHWVERASANGTEYAAGAVDAVMAGDAKRAMDQLQYAMVVLNWANNQLVPYNPHHRQWGDVWFTMQGKIWELQGALKYQIGMKMDAVEYIHELVDGIYLHGVQLHYFALQAIAEHKPMEP